MQRRPQHHEPAGSELSAIAEVLAAGASTANGDDAAPVHVPGGLACVTTDTAVAGVHLHDSLTAWQMGYRATACALSDLAAMAAIPAAVTCSISVPHARWHDASTVAAGVRARALEARTELVGGDMVAAAPAADGPGRWAISVTCIGTAGSSGLVLRSGARPGDHLFVTGTLGLGHAGLARLDSAAACGSEAASTPIAADRYLMPPDRLRAAHAIGPYCTAMIDLSDGLAADARHIAQRSGCGVHVDLDAIPVAQEAAALAAASYDDAAIVAATAGDDYELLVAAAPSAVRSLRSALQRVEPRLALTRIGSCTEGGAITFLRHGRPLHQLAGYEHGA